MSGYAIFAVGFVVGGFFGWLALSLLIMSQEPRKHGTERNESPQVAQ